MKAQAVLGQFPGAATGRDAADLVAMAPFSGPYLTLVFPQSKWGTNNGDYTTDFRAFNRRPGQWTFEVRADTAGQQVVLRWEGDRNRSISPVSHRSRGLITESSAALPAE
jgi:hypothetical protein